MKQNLIEVLNRNKIEHPSVVERLVFFDDSAEIWISGFPWWLSNRVYDCVENAKFEIYGISDASVTRDWFLSEKLQDDLESLSIKRMSEVEWNQGAHAKIYCSEPISDLISILAIMEDYLLRSECPFSAHHFLNIEDGLSVLIQTVKSSSFLLCEGPLAVCNPIIRRLEEMDVKHTIVEQERSKQDTLILTWWDGYIIAKEILIDY